MSKTVIMRLFKCLLFAAFAIAASPTKRQDAVPSYAKQYAPLLHLYSQETYQPSDIGTQLDHTIPEVNYHSVSSQTYTLDNLNELDSLGNTSVYLTSKEGIQAFPTWFNGVKPDSNGVVSGAKTCAVVVVDKPNVDGGVTDVFYFYFYAYNQGNNVVILTDDLGQFGDHVGDWEHNMVRFKDGVPQAVWYSQHAFGEAFTYSAVQKQGDRPITYVGNGTHANWATSGPHDHTLQLINLPDKGVLTDYTDDGPLYDPVASSYYYNYDLSTQQFTSYDSSPVNWLYFGGQWGDEQLPSNTPGQVILFGQAKYSSGPNGPIFKGLDRTNVCPSSDPVCIVSPILTS